MTSAQVCKMSVDLAKLQAAGRPGKVESMQIAIPGKIRLKGKTDLSGTEIVCFPTPQIAEGSPLVLSPICAKTDKDGRFDTSPADVRVLIREPQRASLGDLIEGTCYATSPVPLPEVQVYIRHEGFDPILLTAPLKGNLRPTGYKVPPEFLDLPPERLPYPSVVIELLPAGSRTACSLASSQCRLEGEWVESGENAYTRVIQHLKVHPNCDFADDTLFLRLACYDHENADETHQNFRFFREHFMNGCDNSGWLSRVRFKQYKDCTWREPIAHLEAEFYPRYFGRIAAPRVKATTPAEVADIIRKCPDLAKFSPDAK
jgi:hypothetical protein